MKSSSSKSTLGEYYTPPILSRFVIESALLNFFQKLEIIDAKMNTIADLTSVCNIKERIKQVKILDLGIGDGAFLLAAGKYLEKFYQSLNLEGSILKRIDILENNLYGVDYNPIAINNCRKKLKNWILGETYSTEHLELITEKKHVFNKVKVGNVLFGNISLHDSNDVSPLLPDDMLDGIRVKPFHWNKNFPHIFNQQRSGFDVILCNPPYVTKNIPSEDIRLYRFLYHDKILVNRFNLYHLFFARVKDLLDPNGIAAFLTANSILTDHYSTKLRNYLLSNFSITNIVDFVSRKNLFPNILQGTCLVIFRKKNSNISEHQTKVIRTFDMASLKQGDIKQDFIPFSKLLYADKLIPSPFKRTFEILHHLKNKCIHLNEVIMIQSGEIRPADKNIRQYYFKEILPELDLTELDLVLNGKNIAPYIINLSKTRQKPRWYKRPKLKEQRLFRDGHASTPRIVFQRITAREQLRRVISGVIDQSYLKKYTRVWAENNVNYLLFDSRTLLNDTYPVSVLLGIFNSLLINWFLHQINLTAAIPPKDIGLIPIPRKENINISLLDSIEKNVNSLKKLLYECRSSSEILKQLCPLCFTNREVNQLRKSIDKYVYELYNINEIYQTEVENQLKILHNYF
ncbi:MAG: Eco57I restriction-modification methylase domain-containing protein, partial [Candidatus Hodarchaeota archaeon]